MSRSHRRKIWKQIGLSCILLVTVAAVSIALHEYRVRKQCEILYQAAEEQLLAYQTATVTPSSAREDVREIFVAEAELAEHLETGDRIDVRIRYFNAEDYLVVSDKLLLKSEVGSGMVLELTEEEILLLSSAISDSQVYEGTKLYVVAYPEYQQMEAGMVSYIANRDILLMMGRETTEGESRIALEQRLEQKNQ